MFRGFTQRLCIAVVAASAPAACVKHLPPAPPPPPLVPPIQAAAAPANGQSRLVVDVVEGPTAVQRIQIEARPEVNAQGRTTYQFSERPEIMCTASPCVADLPPGNVLIGFPVIGNPDASELELVNVGPDPSVYRRSLSVYEDRSGGLRVFGIISTAVGGSALVTGTALLPIGLAKDNDGLTTAGAISLGAGAALLAFGIWAIRHDSPTYRPGSSNHFPIASPSH